jgi:cobalt-zinc-cadmium efflux system protein
MEHTKEYMAEETGGESKMNVAFVTGISLNFLFVIVEVVAGLYINSLSLLSDAGHNFVDVISLALSMVAFRLMKVRPNDRYTYGYRKTSILAALINTMFLLLSIGAILIEALKRLFAQEPTSGSTIAIVAAFGIVINGITALMFLRDKEKDMNIRSAYLHLMSDALLSAGIVAGGIIIRYTSWYWVDSVFSISVSIIILFSIWKLLRTSLRLSLDGVPGDINLEDIRSLALRTEGIRSIHHIHVWAISTTENALTAHIVIAPDKDCREEQKIKNNFKFALEKKNIRHVTLETEIENAGCGYDNCKMNLPEGDI